MGRKPPPSRLRQRRGRSGSPTISRANGSFFFSHPADFTPVCTSEFMTFGAMSRDFERLGCQLIGLSVDSLSSHLAWLHTIRERIEFNGMKNVDVRFPLIDDVSMHVATLYGMIHPGESGTKAVRAVFFIDPDAVIRAIIYYPLALGRNFDELRRVLVGLQTIDRFHVSLPADWRPGDEVVVPSPGTMDALDRQEGHPADGVTCHDWFFCTRKLTEEEQQEMAIG
ncbi:MAG: peroxiredoxin [Alistipes ihumii]